jgi:hypothetical protein
MSSVQAMVEETALAVLLKEEVEGLRDASFKG